MKEVTVGITTETPVHCHYGCTGAGMETCCRWPFHSSQLTNDSLYCCRLSYRLFSTHLCYCSYQLLIYLQLPFCISTASNLSRPLVICRGSLCTRPITNSYNETSHLKLEPPRSHALKAIWVDPCKLSIARNSCQSLGLICIHLGYRVDDFP
jgi:hypothetical protein